MQKTAGPPAAIELISEQELSLLNDGEDLLFVQIRVTDREGILRPDAAHRIYFELEGPVELAGIANGDPTSLETFDQNHIHLFNGMALAIFRAKEGKSGEARILARAEHLAPGELFLDIRIP